MNTIYSKKFSVLYDSLMENYDDIIRPTKRLVYEYTKSVSKLSLLELGCGTGTVLKSFPKEFELYGLDIAPGMLAVARRKVKRATFFEGDMSNFSLHRKFDVIISVFDSINHLTKFSDWEKMFTCVHKHLTKNGMFVFDMNTPKRHKALSLLPAYVEKTTDRIVCIKIIETGKHIYTARFEVFTHLEKDKISLFEEQLPEASFPVQKVVNALKKMYIIEKIVDPYREKVTKDAGRLFFACRKR